MRSPASLSIAAGYKCFVHTRSPPLDKVAAALDIEIESPYTERS